MWIDNGMQYNNMGDSGLTLSKLTFGTGNFLSEFLNDKDNMYKQLSIAYNNGINTFDTADVYGQGNAQKFLSNFFNDLPRESFQVSTKVGNKPWDAKYNGLSRKHIIDSLENSLKDLGLDYIDMFSAHLSDNQTPIEETLETFEYLKNSGKIMYYGVCNFEKSKMEEIFKIQKERNYSGIKFYQTAYSAVQKKFGLEMLELCKQNGIGFMAAAPLYRGLLTGKYKDKNEYQNPLKGTSNDYDAVKIQESLNKTNFLQYQPLLEELALKYNATVSQISLAWVHSQKGVTTAIIGSSTPEQLKENIKSKDVVISDEDINYLKINMLDVE
jgi:aryl-alcohol dehydrogenase-like predicted oxidoreductase